LPCRWTLWIVDAFCYDAASDRLRQFVAEIRMVPENGTLSIMVKANAEKLLEAGGLILSSNVGCGGTQPAVLAAVERGGLAIIWIISSAE
jgi:hypothetical protein